MLNIEELKIYAAVVKHLNFTAAAKSLGISKQLVSRRMMQMEARLGARLLNRTTRTLSVTELGRAFHTRCLQVLQALDEAEQVVANESSELRGLLRISAPVSYASMVLAPALNAFMLLHPKLEVSVDVDNRLVDIIDEGYDLAIRITKMPDAGLIAKKLRSSPMIYCCSPSYAALYGVPESAKQLTTHRCITHGAAEWAFMQNNELIKLHIQPVLRSNHGEVMREAAIAGLGITCLPKFYVIEALNDGRLIAILQTVTPDLGDVYAIYPQHKQASTMVRAFAEHLQQWFKPTI